MSESKTEIKLLPGLVTLLTIVFVVAKIWGKIDWNWWLVFSPLWISAGLTILVILIVLIFWALFG